MRLTGWIAGAVLAVAAPAMASPGNPWEIRWDGSEGAGIERNVSVALEHAFEPDAEAAASVAALQVPTVFADAAAAQGSPRTRASAVEYSEAYSLRRKIHKAASMAMLPLFGVEWYEGNKLFNLEGTNTTRSVHKYIATSIAALFAVNTVTGVWNLWEGRKDPNGRTRRMVHGLLMLVADAGFVATGATAPRNRGEEGTFATLQDPTKHRSVAYFSMGTATVAYLMMLFK